MKLTIWITVLVAAILLGVIALCFTLPGIVQGAPTSITMTNLMAFAGIMYLAGIFSFALGFIGIAGLLETMRTWDKEHHQELTSQVLDTIEKAKSQLQTPTQASTVVVPPPPAKQPGTPASAVG